MLPAVFVCGSGLRYSGGSGVFVLYLYCLGVIVLFSEGVLYVRFVVYSIFLCLFWSVIWGLYAVAISFLGAGCDVFFYSFCQG